MLAVLLASVSWALPVGGDVAREFRYRPDAPFRAGWHRGADFAAAPGARVRAACTGVVATARPGLVTLHCGPWRVTHLPVVAVAVRAGARVSAGSVIGRVGSLAGHAGLHVGVRREGSRFGYVDPLRFLPGWSSPPPVGPAPRVERKGPRSAPKPGPRAARPGPAGSRAMPQPAAPPRPASLGAPRAAPHSDAPRAAPHPAAAHAAPHPDAPHAAPLPIARLRAPPPPRVRVPSPDTGGGLAPWPAWLGLAVLLLGAIGGGVRVRARRGRAAVSASVASAR